MQDKVNACQKRKCDILRGMLENYFFNHETQCMAFYSGLKYQGNAFVSSRFGFSLLIAMYCATDHQDTNYFIFVYNIGLQGPECFTSIQFEWPLKRMYIY